MLLFVVFCSYFGTNDDIINPFWNLLTFRWEKKMHGFLIVSKDTTTFSELGAIFILRKGVLRLFWTTHLLYKDMSLHKVRENCHFLDRPPTPMSLRNIKMAPWTTKKLKIFNQGFSRWLDITISRGGKGRRRPPCEGGRFWGRKIFLRIKKN